MASDRQRRLIIILVAVLLAVLAVSGAILWLLPSSSTPDISNNTEESNEEIVVANTGEAYNMAVLQRAVYKSLNLGVLQSGLLPVKPPAAAGKANPFL